MMLEVVELSTNYYTYTADAIFDLEEQALIIRFSQCAPWFIEQILDAPDRYFTAANRNGTLYYSPVYTGKLNNHIYADAFANNTLQWKIKFVTEDDKYDYPSKDESEESDTSDEDFINDGSLDYVDEWSSE